MEQKPKTMRERYREAGLSDELCGVDFCAYLEAALASRKGILLTGPNGTGKTRRLEFAAREFGVQMVGARQFGCDFCRDVTESYNIGRAARLRRYDSVDGVTYWDGLAIDDLGTEWGEAVVFGTRIHPMAAILEERLDNWRKAVTLISTNLNPKEVAMAYGPRVASRMQEAMVVVALSGPDRRAFKA